MFATKFSLVPTTYLLGHTALQCNKYSSYMGFIFSLTGRATTQLWPLMCGWEWNGTELDWTAVANSITTLRVHFWPWKLGS